MNRIPYLLLTFFLGVASSFAQAPTPNRPAYEAELIQLSEILGALHYLRPLCGGSEQGQWRAEMQALIDAAQLPGDKRGLLVTSFNRGYISYEQTYRTCTPAAREAIRRFLDEGARLSRDIALRYGN
ncbi:MAG: TIGR02301 family protein [Xanthobacteraceae bacterium]|nr:TIGR02301 family protein [Xanthobacteraceae bacterium]